VLPVHAPGVTEDQDVIEEHQDEHPNEIVEDVIHECLECRRHIGEAEWHDQELEVVVVRAECHFLHVSWIHEHLVVLAA
jgi:acyl-CoA thioesterase FadM